MKIFYIGLLFLLVITIGTAQDNMPPVFEMNKDTSGYRLDTLNFQVLEDKGGKYSIEDVRNAPISDGFRNEPYLNRNRRASTYWTRMVLKNNLGYDKNLWLVINFGDFADAFIFNESGDMQQLKSGNLLPYSQITGKNGDKARFRIPFTIEQDQELIIYERLNAAPWNETIYYISPMFDTDEHRIETMIENYRVKEDWKEFIYSGIMIGILLLAACYNLLTYFSIKDKVYLYFGLCLLFFIFDRHNESLSSTLFREYAYYFNFCSNFFKVLFFYFFVQFLQKFLQKDGSFKKLHLWINIFMGLAIFTTLLHLNVRFYSLGMLMNLDIANTTLTRITYLFVFILNYKMWRQGHPYSHFSLLAITPIFLYWSVTFAFFITSIFINRELNEVPWKMMPYIENGCLTWLIIVFSATLISRFNKVQKQVTNQEIESERMEREREIERTKLIESQKEMLEKQVAERTVELQNSLISLQSAQNQLVQKEKLASLGELTAGIAHEIQNPLNFVNNFSELSVELADELKDELGKEPLDKALIEDLIHDLTQNQTKINHHGKRASSIVKGMLEHSRASTGERAMTDINALADEYLRLSYHGMRARDKSFNANFKTELEENLPKLNVIPQDLGRVLLNLINNAFYAVNERNRLEIKDLESAKTFTPSVFVSTKRLSDAIEIRVKDNGTGMPDSVKAKVFQPFFTTKPTGEGTGLGLSLSYDIITKGHGGTLEVVSTEGVGTAFIIRLALAQ